MTVWHLVGMIVTLGGIVLAGVLSGRGVKNASDFEVSSGRAGPLLVAGSLISANAGGNMTMGTAQLAYSFGLSAIWFGAGSFVGFLLVGLVFAKPFRKQEYNSFTRGIGRQFGLGMERVTSVLLVLICLVSLIAQLMAGRALLTSILPISETVASLLLIGLALVYVVFGGMRSAGTLGFVKSLLMLGTVLTCVCAVFIKFGGFSLLEGLDKAQYANPFARGAAVDLSPPLSTLLGMGVAQNNLTAMKSARSLKCARRTAVASAFLVLLVGLGSTMVGMAMRALQPAMKNTAMTFCSFALINVHPLLGGVMIAALLVAIVGTMASITLGGSTIFVNSLYGQRQLHMERAESAKRSVWIQRGVITAMMLMAFGLTFANLGEVIININTLAVGLSAMVSLAPVYAILFLPGRLDKRVALSCSIVGVVTVGLTSWLASGYVVPSLAGAAAELITALLGTLILRRIPNKGGLELPS